MYIVKMTVGVIDPRCSMCSIHSYSHVDLVNWRRTQYMNTRATCVPTTSIHVLKQSLLMCRWHTIQLSNNVVV